MNQIAIFIPSLRGGGAECIMMTLANRFAELGHPVDIVLVKAEGPYLSEVASNVRIVDLNASRTLLALCKLIKYLKREKPQVLLSAMSHTNIIAILSRLCSGLKIRLVISERNTASMDMKSLRPYTAFLMKHAIRLLYPFADHITAVSAGVADDLAKNMHLKRSSIEVIYNPVYSDKLIEDSLEDPGHDWLSKQNIETTPVILAAGRLAPQKDFQTLILAFAIVKAQREARLIILGEGEQKGQLELLVDSLGLKAHVSFPGFVINPFSFMRRASVFVLSSRWEGFPSVLVQAMACGARVVSTDCQSGPREILEGGKWGRLVPVGDTEAMANAILDVIQDSAVPDVALRAKNFDVDTATSKYLFALAPTIKTH